MHGVVVGSAVAKRFLAEIVLEVQLEVDVVDFEAVESKATD